MFRDEPPAGRWTLKVSDIEEDDRGVLLYWKLDLFGSQ